MVVPILVLEKMIGKSDLAKFRDNPFESMIKFVVDTKKEKIALGGEMHADGEQIFLESGSRQDDLWGANLYPWDDEWRIEYISLINIRPHLGNKKMEIVNEEKRKEIRSIVMKWIDFS